MQDDTAERYYARTVWDDTPWGSHARVRAGGAVSRAMAAERNRSEEDTDRDGKHQSGRAVGSRRSNAQSGSGRDQVPIATYHFISGCRPAARGGESLAWLGGTHGAGERHARRAWA